MNKTQCIAEGIIGAEKIRELKAEGIALVPERLPIDAVGDIKDMMAEEYAMYDISARPLWSELLGIVARDQPNIENENQQTLILGHARIGA